MTQNTDTRAAFEKAMNDARFFPRELDFSRTKSPSGRDEYVNSHLQSEWIGWQAALEWNAEAAKATSVAAGELFGYGSSEKKNCLMSKAQFDNCLPKNRTAYDIPLYAYKAPSCATCNDHGSVGRPPDDYWPCPDCTPAARQPAPVLPVKRWEDRANDAIATGAAIDHFNGFRDAEIADLRAALAATAAPVLSDEQKNAIRFAAEALEGLDYEDTAGDLLAILRSQP